MNTARKEAQRPAYIINYEKLEQSMKHITEQPSEMSMQIIAGVMPMVYTAYNAGVQGIPFEECIPFVERIEE